MERYVLARPPSPPRWPPASTPSGATSQSQGHILRPLQTQVCLKLLLSGASCCLGVVMCEGGTVCKNCENSVKFDDFLMSCLKNVVLGRDKLHTHILLSLHSHLLLVIK